MKLRRLLIENLEHRRVLAVGGLSAPALESVIVSLNDNVVNPKAVGQGTVNAHGGHLGHVYQHSIKGFSAQLPAAAIAALTRDPNVKRVEPDLAMQAFSQTIPKGIDRIDGELHAVANINGLDERVNVNIAIIDSGIDSDHPDLNVVGGRRFYSVTSGPPKSRGGYQDSNFDDDNGHGTHVAGTAAALDNDFGVVGVAPGARLFAVKVLDSSGSGNLSDIIAGIDWVTSTRTDTDLSNDIEVANMSLGGVGVSTAYHDAIKQSVDAGVVYVVAAGNSYRDILGTDFQFGTGDDTIPAAYPEVATISAFADTDGRPGNLGGYTLYTDPAVGPYPDDTFADFSNFSNSQAGGASYYNSNNKVTSPGLGIDLMMPGVDIVSTARNGGYATMSGTSMASPHAAGLAALYVAQYGRATNAAEVYAIRQALIDQGKGWKSPEGLYVPNPTYNPDSPDNHIENLGWAGSVLTHDVAITSVTATPAMAFLGATIQISVDVANQGTFDENFDVNITVDGQIIHVAPVSLVAGSMTTIALAWNPTAEGSFVVAASAVAVAGESDTVDNAAATQVDIVTPVHDLALTSISVASSVVQGEAATVTVQVTNQGTYSEKAVVTLAELPDGTSAESQSLTDLAPGSTATFTFLWATGTGISLGDHTLTATVAPVSDETDTADNSATATVAVIDVPSSPLDLILDDGDAGYSTTGSWSTRSNASAYNADYDTASGGNGSAEATWSIAGLPAGQFEVFATWVSHPKKHASNTQYSVHGTTVLVDQRTSPDGTQIAGWQRLTTIAHDGNGDVVVRLNNNANGIVVADAIRVVSVPVSTNRVQFISHALPSSKAPTEATAILVAAPEVKKKALPIDSYFATFDDAANAELAMEVIVPQSSSSAPFAVTLKQLSNGKVSGNDLTI